jgi:hypothetical protein
MIYPANLNLQDLTTNQIEEKIKRLNSMYFMTENSEVRQQMILLLDTYKIELEERRLADAKRRSKDGKNDLDGLINIS